MTQPGATETCSCGARIDVPWPTIGTWGGIARIDSTSQLDAFREAHTACRAVPGATTGTDPHG